MSNTKNELIEKLYIEMASKMNRYAYQTLRDEALAEEAVQTAFMDACAKTDSVMASPNPQGWVKNAVKIVVKRIVARQIRDSKLTYSDKEYTELIGAEVHSDEIDPDVLYGNLKDDPDYILFRKYTEERRSLSDLASEFGISSEACKKRLQRARVRIQKKLREL